MTGKSLELSSQNVSPTVAAWRSLALALMEYRRGHYRQVVDWCDRSLDYENDLAARVASVQSLLAMTHMQLGESNQAWRELAKSRNTVEGTFARGLGAKRNWDGYWFDWLFARILLNEATSLHNGPDDKSAAQKHQPP